MQFHVTVVNRSTVTFTDPQDVNALREMAQQTIDRLGPAMRSTVEQPYERRRAYQLALWLVDRVPESAT